MYKNATKCNETIGKWCKNKHGASKIIDTFETYQRYHFQQEPIGVRDPRRGATTSYLAGEEVHSAVIAHHRLTSHEFEDIS
jgi:hypothetical protein